MFTVEWAEYKEYAGVERKRFTGTREECLNVLHNLEGIFLASDPVFVQNEVYEETFD